MNRLGILLILILTMFAGCAHRKADDPQAPATLPLAQVKLRDHISLWPEASRAAAEELLSKYGLPQEVNEDSLVWLSPGPFKKAVIWKEGIYHAFPTPHTDVLQEVLDYRVPLSKVDDLWAFNGSILLDRTRGEISSRCDQEPTNILSLNFANSIILGKLSVREARDRFRQEAQKFASGAQSELAKSLTFLSKVNTADPDRNIEAPLSAPPRKRQAQEARE